MQDLPDGHDLGHLRAAIRDIEGRRCAIDAGAHRGIWAREMHLHFDVVYAFEPVRALYCQLPEPRFNCALGDEWGWCSIAPGKENTGQGHVIEGYDTEVLTLDSFNIRDVDLLKIDVEGYELHVLMGAVETINVSRPAILLEKNGLCERYRVTDSDIDAWLAERDYIWEWNYNKDHLYLPR